MPYTETVEPLDIVKEDINSNDTSVNDDADDDNNSKIGGDMKN
jgi:hypothetical protein